MSPSIDISGDRDTVCVYDSNHQVALSVVRGSVFYGSLYNRQVPRIKHSGLSLRWAELEYELFLPHTHWRRPLCVHART